MTDTSRQGKGPQPRTALTQTETVPPAAETPQAKGNETPNARREPRATWRITVPSTLDGLFGGKDPLVRSGEAPWCLAYESREMLLWRRQMNPTRPPDGPEAKSAKKTPVTWLVKL